MRFAIITDIHLGPEFFLKGVQRRINKNVKQLVNKFIQDMNKNEKPEFVISLGDSIEHDSNKKDKKRFEYLLKTFEKLNCPSFFAAGNHDLINLSEEELKKILNKKELYYSFNKKNFHFVVLFSKTQKDRSIAIPDKQKKWFEKDLKKTKKKTIVFVHHGLADQNLKGNPWFEGRPKNCLISNRKEIREIINKSKKVIGVFNGHLHWDKKHTHKGIPYFTIQSLTENEGDKGLSSNAYAVIDIDDKKIDVKIKGNYPKRFKHIIKE